ncbi:MAG: tetratricopeptide repeat protein, partial [Ignavibacteria bacterium]|nr:tetratricopeptide repeat protein [Ignavibacteria bacterium]
MKYYINTNLIIIFIAFIGLQLISYAQSDLSEKNITSFDQEIIDQKIFQIEQNYKLDKEKLISSVSSKSEKVLLNSILLYKDNRFNEAFDLLYSHMDIASIHYKFCEYLAKTAHILGKTPLLLSNIENEANEDSASILIGFINYNAGEYEKAQVVFEDQCEQNKNHVPTYIYLSNTYRRLGNYQKANEILINAIGLISDQNPILAELLIARGSLAFLSGDYVSAETLYNNGLKLARETNNNIEVVKATLNLAMIKDLYGKIELARTLFNEAYILAEKIKHPELQAIVLSEWAVSFTYTNEPIEARNRYEESFK